MSHHSNRLNVGRGRIQDFLERDVFPQLEVERVFSHSKHEWTRTNDRELIGACPQHESQSGTCFKVQRKNLVWYCHSCKVGGGPIQYLAMLAGRGVHVRGDEYVRFARELAELAHVPFPEVADSEEDRRHAEFQEARRALLEASVEHFQVNLWSEAGAAARAYLRDGRGFADEEIRELEFGLALEPDRLRQELVAAKHDLDLSAQAGVLSKHWFHYITIPWRDEFGDLLNIYGRYAGKDVPDGHKKLLSLPGEEIKRVPLYLDRALRAGHREIVIVEGVFDAAMAQARGDARVVALAGVQVSGGQALTIRLRRIESVTICLDPDRAGAEGTVRCIRGLQAESILVRVAPKLPDGLDPDEFIRKEGIEAWREHVGRAITGDAHRIGLLVAKHRSGTAWTDATRDAFLAEAEQEALAEPASRLLVDEFLVAAKERSSDAIGEVLRGKATMRALGHLKLVDVPGFHATLIDLRGRGVKAKEIDALKSAVGAVADAIDAEQAEKNSSRAATNNELAVVDPALNAPVPKSLMIPAGYEVTARGIAVEKIGSDDEPYMKAISPTPILIAARYADIDDGTERVKLTWFRDNSWRTHVVSRRSIADVRDAMEMSNVGFPVMSATASEIVQYLSSLEQVNLAVLPRIKMTHRLGWHEVDGNAVFLWGSVVIDEKGVGSSDAPESAAALTFHASDAGDEQLVSGFRKSGEFDGWKHAIKNVIAFPIVIAGLLVSLSTPLLRIIAAPNPILDWCSPTSKGKTTSLRLAASVWGCPDESGGLSIVRSWDATRVFVERLGAIFHSLPLFLDETSMADGTGNIVKNLIYQVASGQGRGRGSTKGVRRTGAWKTGLLTTGEQPITSFAEGFGGTYARVLSFWGSPFGKEDHAALADALNAAVIKNYGHAGPAFVHYVIQHRDEWAQWREQYDELVENYQGGAANSVAARLARTVAALDITAKLVSTDGAGVLPWSYAELTTAIQEAWKSAVVGAAEADRSEEALHLTISWARRNRDNFAKDSTGEGTAPTMGWAGRWDHVANWTHLSFFPDQLERLLLDWSFNPKATLSAWRDERWLDVAGGDRMKKQVCFQGARPWMYAIPRHVVDAIEPGVRADG